MIVGGPPHDVRERERRAAELDFPARDAGEIEQVVHEPRQVRELAVQDGAGAARGVARGVGPIEQGERVPHRREGVAKLVREQREELVLAVVGRDEGLLPVLALRDVERDAADADRRAGRVVLGAADLPDPALAQGGVLDAELGAVLVAELDRGRERGDHGRCVRGHRSLLPRGDVRSARSERRAVQGVALAGHPRGPGDEVELPDAGVGRALREPEEGLARTQLLLHAVAGGDVVDGRDGSQPGAPSRRAGRRP